MLSLGHGKPQAWVCEPASCGPFLSSSTTLTIAQFDLTIGHLRHQEVVRGSCSSRWYLASAGQRKGRKTRAR